MTYQEMPEPKPEKEVLVEEVPLTIPRQFPTAMLKPVENCPTWNQLGAGEMMAPFFNPKEELKRKGFKVTFLGDGPRKETENSFNPGTKELWFDILYQGQIMTWTINQISLLLELKRYAPLTGKEFLVQLVPVDDEFKKLRPNYRGKDRYQVCLLNKQVEANHDGR